MKKAIFVRIPYYYALSYHAKTKKIQIGALFFSEEALNVVNKFPTAQQSKRIHGRNGLCTVFPQSRVVMVNNRDFNIGQKKCMISAIIKRL